MPISLTAFKEGNICEGYTWTINDEAKLADQIALIALGLSHHVRKILVGAKLRGAATDIEVAESAIKYLTVDGTDPWQRDGWIFQCISWIAAGHASPNGFIAAPQMAHAQKGFDGMQLEIDSSTGKVCAAIIFEDKATEDARTMVRAGVWPEFLRLEKGERMNEITAQVISLLQANGIPDPDEAIENIIWKGVRRYRLSITVDEKHNTTKGRSKLFAGYEQIAADPISRRRGETIYIPQLRVWMQKIADKSILAIRARVI